MNHSNVRYKIVYTDDYGKQKSITLYSKERAQVIANELTKCGTPNSGPLPYLDIPAPYRGEQGA